jgi:hypothetical protein
MSTSFSNLYDLNSDPTESTSLLSVSTYADAVASMEERGEYWQSRVLEPQEATNVDKKQSVEECVHGSVSRMNRL